MGLIRVTYETITPESAEQGDFADHGWIDEAGTKYSVAEVIALVAGCEPSSSHFHRGVWYTQADGDTDYSTGEETRRSYHLSGFSEASERRIFRAVVR